LIFKELAPWELFFTLVLTASMAIKIKKVDIFCIEGIAATAGLGLGLIITLLNFTYSNNYLITGGPLLVLACLLYLRYRGEILDEGKFDFHLLNESLKLIQIIYWVFLCVALISYYQASSGFRPLIFFISISIIVTSLSLEIIFTQNKTESYVYRLFFKILLSSLILRLSAYFISPYPVGSDPWEHADLIRDVLSFGTIDVPKSITSVYYSNYPLMHLLSCIISLVGNLNVKGSMSIIGSILTLSTIFIYLFSKKITNNISISLLSMLLINFADFHVQWSIQVIAMTFGIALYTMLIYGVIKKEEKSLHISIFLTTIIFAIVWTHTVSSFISFLSIISLYMGSLVYSILYKREIFNKFFVGFNYCILFSVILLVHWIDPQYPFFEMVTRGLIASLSNEASFLGSIVVSTYGDTLDSILNILGFLIYIFFGAIGSLYFLSREHANIKTVSLISMLVVLFFVFLVFPVMGIRNIVPYRWPAFIYVSLVMFVSTGLFIVLKVFKRNTYRCMFIIIVIFMSSFFMITNFATNLDSPTYGNELSVKLIWTEAEMTSFSKMDHLYEGVIVTDAQTQERPFQVYLKRKKISAYQTNNHEDLNWNYMKDKLIVWRKTSLERSVQIGDSSIVLGNEFKKHLDSNFNSIYDVGDSKFYLGTGLANGV